MKALLSGAPLENTILRKRTFVAKTLGLLFAIGSGLYVGKEGPWVHTSTPRGASTEIRFSQLGMLTLFCNVQHRSFATCSLHIFPSFAILAMYVTAPPLSGSRPRRANAGSDINEAIG